MPTNKTRVKVTLSYRERAALKEHAAQRGMDMTPAELEGNVRNSLGYISGYYEPETAQRILKLARTTHPVFGTAFANMSAESADND